MKSTLLRVPSVLLIFTCISLTSSLRASEEGEDLRAADATLNKTYQKTLSSMPNAAAKSKLREAQRAWVAFRDAEISLNGALPAATGNTLKMLQTDLTTKRIQELKSLAEAVRNGDIE